MVHYKCYKNKNNKQTGRGPRNVGLKYFIYLFFLYLCSYIVFYQVLTKQLIAKN